MFQVARTMLTVDGRGLMLAGKHVLAPLCPDTGRIDMEFQLQPVVARLAAAYMRPVEERTVTFLKSAATAWNKGDAGRAAYDLIQIRLPDPLGDADFDERLRLVDGALAAGSRPDEILKALNMSLPHWMTQPRLSAGQTGGGEWATSGGGDASLQYVADKPGQGTPTCVLTSGFGESGDKNINAMKQKFVTDHMHDASIVAQQLGITTAQVLGLAALEGKWGNGPFVVKGGNNYFGQHYPAPGGGGPIPGHNQDMAQYPDFAASAESFRRQSGSLIQGITDPKKFVQTLQDVRIQNGKLITPGRYGIDTDTNEKVPGYVKDVVSIIHNIAKHIRSNT